MSSVQDMDSHHNAYPPHLETIYDYMSRLGEFQYVFDPAKLAAQQAQAQKAASGAGNAVDLKTDATGPASVKTPASPKPAAAKSTTKQ